MKETKEEITIGTRSITILVEDGIKWYPLTKFFKTFLYRNVNPKTYRDTTFIKYMKVFQEVTTFKSGKEFVVNRWYVNEEGMKLILRNISPHSGDKMYHQIQEEGLKNCCIYFDIRRERRLNSRFAYGIKNFVGYSPWERICLETDERLNPQTLWLKCRVCNRYFPAEIEYFGKNRNTKLKINSKCKTCDGYHVLPFNPKLYKWLKVGGENFAIEMYKENYPMAFKELHKYKPNTRYTPIEFLNSDVFVSILIYMRDNFFRHPQREFSYTNLTKYFTLSISKMQELVGNKLYVPKTANLYCQNGVLTDEGVRIMVKEKFPEMMLSKKMLDSFSQYEPVAGIITPKGVVLFCHKRVPCKKLILRKIPERKYAFEKTLEEFYGL